MCPATEYLARCPNRRSHIKALQAECNVAEAAIHRRKKKALQHPRLQIRHAQRLHRHDISPDRNSAAPPKTSHYRSTRTWCASAVTPSRKHIWRQSRPNIRRCNYSADSTGNRRSFLRTLGPKPVPAISRSAAGRHRDDESGADGTTPASGAPRTVRLRQAGSGQPGRAGQGHPGGRGR